MTRARPTDERGLSAVELVLAVSILLVVLASAVVFLTSAAKTVAVTTEQTQSIDEGRITLARLAGEVRRSAAVEAASGDCPLATCLILTVDGPGGAILDVRYRYDAGERTLSRSTRNLVIDPWTTEETVVRNVVNGAQPVFCRGAPCTQPLETAVQIILDLNADPDEPRQVVRLESYVTPRNL